jgi:hypothetical protein
MNPERLENQRIKLSRQIAKDMQKLARLDATRQSIQSGITRAERLKADVERKLAKVKV